MLNRKHITAGILTAALLFSATPSFAFDKMARDILIGAVLGGVPGAVGVALAEGAFASEPAPPLNYANASWYRNWEGARGSGSSVVAYNQRCSMSDGQREIAIPCQVVARAFSGSPISPSNAVTWSMRTR